jgi:hypothetical protein
MTDRPQPGTIAWVDLTVANADDVRDFYRAVIGWKPAEVTMGEYMDYSMTVADTGVPTAGVCHKRGMNAELPSQWLIYVNVADLDRSMRECRANGGQVIVGPKDMGVQGRYCVIQDPAGAVMALIEAEAGE